MKEFTEYEKKILSKIVEIEEIPGSLNILGNILDFELYPNYYFELKSEDDCILIIRKVYLDEIARKYGNLGVTEIIRQLSNKLLFIVKLFQYLEKEDQIYFAEDIDISTIGTTFGGDESRARYKLEDKDTASLIFRLAKKRIVPTESFTHFVKNNFKTDAQIKLEKEQKKILRKINWTAFGVVVSLFGIISADIFKIVELKKAKGTDQIEIVNDVLKVKSETDTTFVISIGNIGDSLKPSDQILK